MININVKSKYIMIILILISTVIIVDSCQNNSTSKSNDKYDDDAYQTDDSIADDSETPDDTNENDDDTRQETIKHDDGTSESSISTGNGNFAIVEGFGHDENISKIVSVDIFIARPEGLDRSVMIVGTTECEKKSPCGPAPVSHKTVKFTKVGWNTIELGLFESTIQMIYIGIQGFDDIVAGPYIGIDANNNACETYAWDGYQWNRILEGSCLMIRLTIQSDVTE